MLELANLNELTTEIILLKNQTAQNIIEIGKRLIKAKEQIPHGEWGKWLAEKVEFKERTAQRFMKTAIEFSNTSTLTDLNQSKIFALLELPLEQRQDFIESNPVEEMTARQLQAAIKAQKATEKKATDLKNENELLTKALNEKSEPIETIVEKEVIPSDYIQIKSDLEDRKRKYTNLLERNEKLEASMKTFERDSEEYHKLRKQIDLLKQKKDEFSRSIDAITELSSLVFEIEHLLTRELAPIKYSRAISEQVDDPIVQENLNEIVNRVKHWCDEMQILINKNIVESNYEDMNLDDDDENLFLIYESEEN